jgi:hypothetical protein
VTLVLVLVHVGLLPYLSLVLYALDNGCVTISLWDLDWSRLHYTLVTLAALVFIWWLRCWNLLGFWF